MMMMMTMNNLAVYIAFTVPITKLDSLESEHGHYLN